MTSFIERLDVEAYGCIQKESFQLTPLHAFIGPNDSGKSTILRALRTCGQFAAGYFWRDPDTGPAPFDPMIGSGSLGARLAVALGDSLAYELRTTEAGLVERVLVGEESISGDSVRDRNGLGLLTSKRNNPGVARVAERLSVPRLLRLDPDALRLPSRLLLESESLTFFDDRGRGLPSIYDAMISRRFEGFLALMSEVRLLFPAISQVGLRNVSTPARSPSGGGDVWKAMEATLRTGERVPATALSEGLLYFLAFGAIRYLDPTSLLLIEEPENGLHPARIRDIMTTLRAISKTTQVVLATHSPLVINEMEGNEVSVVTRTKEEGTKAILLKDTFNYGERSKVYSNGELWLSHSDGQEERDLLKEPEPAT